MKNISIWKQTDFTGGEDTFNAPHLIPENACSKIVNLVPGWNSQPLTIRGGFQEWSYDERFGDDILLIEPIVTTMLYDVDKYTKTQATLVFNKSASLNAIELNVVTGSDDYTVPTNDDNIPDKVGWTDSGSAYVPEDIPDEDIPDNPPPLPASTRTIVNIPAASKTLSPASGIVLVPYGASWWANSGSNTLNNYDYWSSQEYDSDSIVSWSAWENHVAPYLNLYYDNLFPVAGSLALFMRGDHWEKSTNDNIMWYDTSGSTTGALRFQRESYPTHEDIPGQTTIKNPVQKYPYFIFKENIGSANRDVTFNFGYDGTSKGLSFHVYYRSGGSQGDWLRLTSWDKPIVCVPQTELDLAYRYTEDVLGVIPFTHRADSANVEYKIEAIPTAREPYYRYETLGLTGFLRSITIK